jgi:hypothetical protein
MMVSLGSNAIINGRSYISSSDGGSLTLRNRHGPELREKARERERKRREQQSACSVMNLCSTNSQSRHKSKLVLQTLTAKTTNSSKAALTTTAKPATTCASELTTEHGESITVPADAPSMPTATHHILSTAHRTEPETFSLHNLPPDFHPTANKHLEACFGEAMQVLQGDQIIDPIPNGVEEVDRVARLSKLVLRWASGWGGVACWPITLDESFTHAHKEVARTAPQPCLSRSEAFGTVL